MFLLKPFFLNLLSTLSLCYSYILQHCHCVLLMFYNTVTVLFLYSTLSFCYSYIVQHSHCVIPIFYNIVIVLFLYSTTLPLCYSYILQQCHFVTPIFCNIVIVYSYIVQHGHCVILYCVILIFYNNVISIF